MGWPEFLPDGPPLHLHGDRREGGGERLPDRQARLDGVHEARSGPVDDHVRTAGLPSLRSGPDAGGPDVRREGGQGDRRAGPGRRADRHRCRGLGALLGLARGNARLPDGGVRRRPGLGRSDRAGARGDRRARAPIPTRRSRPAATGSRSLEESAKGDIWVRDIGPRRQLTLHLRRRRRIRSHLVPRRPHASSSRFGHRPDREDRRGSRRGEARC